MTCVNKGLWAQDCQLRIANDGGVSATIQEQGTPIEVASLDNEFTRLGLKRVDFIKMDGGGGKGFRRGHDASWKKPSKEYAARSPSLMPNR